MKIKKRSVGHPIYFCGECWCEYCSSEQKTNFKHIPIGDPVYELSSSDPSNSWTGARFCEKHYIEFLKECAGIAGFELVKQDDDKSFVEDTEDMYMCTRELCFSLLYGHMLTADKRCPRCGCRVEPFNT